MEVERVWPTSTRRYRNFEIMKRKLLFKSRWEEAFRECIPLQDRPEYNPRKNKNLVWEEPVKKPRKTVTDEEVSIM